MAIYTVENGVGFIKPGTKKIKKQAFYENEDLRSIIIPASVTEIGPGAFQYCSQLKEVVIPPSVTKISEEAFYGCKKLTNVVIPDSVIEIGVGAFSGCQLDRIEVPESVTELKSNVFF